MVRGRAFCPRPTFPLKLLPVILPDIRGCLKAVNRPKIIFLPGKCPSWVRKMPKKGNNEQKQGKKNYFYGILDRKMPFFGIIFANTCSIAWKMFFRNSDLPIPILIVF